MGRLAAFAAQAGQAPMPALLAVSGVAWAALLALPPGGGMAAICGEIGFGDLGRLAAATPGFSPWRLAAEAALMVAAMMTPLVAVQVAHVGRFGPANVRIAAAAAFLGAYWAVWIVALAPLLGLAFALTLAVGERTDLPAALGLALLVSASPAAQRARNRCHRTGGAEGPARLGFATGGRCVAACWPWMLAPATAPSLHLAAMALAGAWLFADRIAPPAAPAWRLPPGLETLFGAAGERGAGRLATATARGRRER